MTTPKITDAQMQYYQFKARQTFLLEKENHEWQEFCKRILPQCSSCTIKEGDSKTSKEIGIQTFQRTLPNIKAKSPASSSLQNQQMSEMLSSIKIKLEKIDLTLADMKSCSTEDKALVVKRKPNILYEHIKSSAPNPDEISLESVNILDDRKRQLIQSSLKASLQRLQSSALMGRKEPVSSIKMKNSSFFLPHDLKKQRMAARKAYLASLPKTEAKKPSGFSSVVNRKNKTAAPNPSKKQSDKSEPKFRKKNVKNSPIKQLDESTMVETEELSENKDENVENAVDGILNDLIGEAALVMHRLRMKKKEKQIDIVSSKLQVIEDENNTISKKWDIPTSLSQGVSNENKNLNYQTDEESYRTRVQDVLQRIQDDTERNVHSVSTANVQTSGNTKSVPYMLNMKPHKEISVSSDSRKRIMRQKKNFWRYLESISRTEKEGFNPWSTCDMIAEAILDECILDVAEEVGDVPQSFISNLYNQEFTQLS